MNEHLALKTISDLLQWKEGEDKEEFIWLRLISSYKYDAYEGYEPGIRFYPALIGWLQQFPDIKDKKIAYAFLKKNILFFSRNEIIHLVHRLWPIVQRLIVKAVATELDVPSYSVLTKGSFPRQTFEMRLRQSLFVGLSDGARMDVFRRDNEGKVSNEQTVVAHEISSAKWKDMTKELIKDIEDRAWTIQPKFCHIFLIDDFTASGTSLIRKEEDTGEWKGKVPKFIEQTLEYIKNLSKDGEESILQFPCQVHIHHYLATEKSKYAVLALIQEYGKTQPQFLFDLTFGHIIEPRFNVRPENCKDFYDLVSKHYDPNVETEISKKVQFGYKDCNLAVVLEHNTPNNTVSLIWAETKEEDIPDADYPMRPLFKRRTRHM